MISLWTVHILQKIDSTKYILQFIKGIIGKEPEVFNGAILYKKPTLMPNLAHFLLLSFCFVLGDCLNNYFHQLHHHLHHHHHRFFK